MHILITFAIYAMFIHPLIYIYIYIYIYIFQNFNKGYLAEPMPVELVFIKIARIDSAPAALLKNFHQGSLDFFSAFSEISDMRSIFGKTAGCALQGHNFTKTLIHCRLFFSSYFFGGS